MSEFYIVANSFAAPFFSDTDSSWIEAESPEAALEKFAAAYAHPAGLYVANCYRDANAKEKGEPPLAVWQSNHLTALLEATKDLRGHSYFGRGPGDFDVNGTAVRVKHPKRGAVVKAPAESRGPAGLTPHD